MDGGGRERERERKRKKMGKEGRQKLRLGVVLVEDSLFPSMPSLFPTSTLPSSPLPAPLPFSP